MIDFILFIFQQITRIFTTTMNLTFPIGTLSQYVEIKVIHIVIFIFIIKVILYIIDNPDMFKSRGMKR